MNPKIGLNPKTYNLGLFLKGFKFRILKDCHSIPFENWPKANTTNTVVPMPHVYFKYKDPQFENYNLEPF